VSASLDIDDLSKLIDEAFVGIPYPGDDHLLIDMSGAHLEGERIRSAFAGRDWRDISVDTINANRSALAFLSAAAYAFYLPAFLKAAVTQYDLVDILPNEVIATLTVPDELDLARIEAEAEAGRPLPTVSDAEWADVVETLRAGYRSGLLARVFLDRIAQFDRRQQRAIRRFLEHMRDAHGADFPDRAPEIALERYWSRQ
jgi:hypothetical protein